MNENHNIEDAIILINLLRPSQPAKDSARTLQRWETFASGKDEEDQKRIIDVLSEKACLFYEVYSRRGKKEGNMFVSALENYTEKLYSRVIKYIEEKHEQKNK